MQTYSLPQYPVAQFCSWHEVTQPARPNPAKKKSTIEIFSPVRITNVLQEIASEGTVRADRPVAKARQLQMLSFCPFSYSWMKTSWTVKMTKTSSARVKNTKS